MKAVNGFIILKKDQPTDQLTSSGIILPNFNQPPHNNGIKEPFTGVVLSVGEEVKEYKEGDRLVFSDLAMPDILQVGEDEIIIIKKEDVVGILI